MAGTYVRLYNKEYPDEPNSISRTIYARRKWKILRSMTKTQLLSDFGRDKDFCINKSMSKNAILKKLKQYSWKI